MHTFKYSHPSKRMQETPISSGISCGVNPQSHVLFCVYVYTNTADYPRLAERRDANFQPRRTSETLSKQHIYVYWVGAESRKLSSGRTHIQGTLFEMPSTITISTTKSSHSAAFPKYITSVYDNDEMGISHQASCRKMCFPGDEPLTNKCNDSHHVIFPLQKTYIFEKLFLLNTFSASIKCIK